MINRKKKNSKRRPNLYEHHYFLNVFIIVTPTLGFNFKGKAATAK